MTSSLQPKIADFGMSKNTAYDDIKPLELYTNLIPPECKYQSSEFTKFGDVYVCDQKKLIYSFQLSYFFFLLVFWMDFDRNVTWKTARIIQVSRNVA